MVDHIHALSFLDMGAFRAMIQFRDHAQTSCKGNDRNNFS